LRNRTVLKLFGILAPIFTHLVSIFLPHRKARVAASECRNKSQIMALVQNLESYMDAEGKTPLLAKIKAEVDRMVAAFRSGLDRHQEGARMFEEGFGTPESTLIWQDLGGVWCRARLDWLRADKRSGIAIDDYKTTATSADPADLARTYIGKGWDIQAAWYLRGARAVLNTTKAFDMTFRYAVQETYAPYAVSVVTPGADALMLAEKKILWALSLWARCLERDEWPGYHTQTAHLALPAWEESRWLTKEVSDAF